MEYLELTFATTAYFRNLTQETAESQQRDRESGGCYNSKARSVVPTSERATSKRHISTRDVAVWSKDETAMAN